MPILEGHRENDPATREAAHAQQRVGSGRLARLKRRTREEGDAPPVILRVLEVVAGRRRLVSRAIARAANYLGLRDSI